MVLSSTDEDSFDPDSAG